MSTPGLKQQALEKLKKLDDDLILREIYRLLQLPDSDNDVHKFTDSQLILLKERERAIEEGEFLTEEAADKEAEEWLRK